MILRNKYSGDGLLARGKARGFAQPPEIHFNETFAPVARLGSIRMLVAIAVNFGVSIRQTDITSTYLYRYIEEVPKYFTEALEMIIIIENSRLQRKAKFMFGDLEKEDKVCLLQKSMYGPR